MITPEDMMEMLKLQRKEHEAEIAKLKAQDAEFLNYVRAVLNEAGILDQFKTTWEKKYGTS